MTDYFETKSQPISKLMVWQAYKIVKANKGGSGIDGMTWEKLDANPAPHLYKLWNRLTSGTYFPNPWSVSPQTQPNLTPYTSLHPLKPIHIMGQKSELIST